MSESTLTLSVSTEFNAAVLSKNCWIVILHASRTPPHVGMMMNGFYSSLTIKGHELNVKAEVLLKMITQKKMEVLMVGLIKQPVFSVDYQKEVFEHDIKQFIRVGIEDATCLTPVKLFLQEFYALPYIKNELLFEITQRLKQKGYIYETVGFNLTNKLHKNEFALPIYSHQQLQDIIKQETI